MDFDMDAVRRFWLPIFYEVVKAVVKAKWITLVREDRKIQPRLGTLSFMLKGTLAQERAKLGPGI